MEQKTKDSEKKKKKKGRKRDLGRGAVGKF